MSAEIQQVQVFIHSQDGSQARAVNTELTLEAVLAAAGITSLDDMSVFVGEPVTALAEPVEVDGEDDQMPVSPHQTLKELGITGAAHIHVHPCKRILVTVHYNAGSKHRKFSPAATIETVTLWARKKFRLTDADASRLILTVATTNQQPRPTQELGELVQVETCAIEFNLSAEHKMEG